jgi:hypothetical protein
MYKQLQSRCGAIVYSYLRLIIAISINRDIAMIDFTQSDLMKRVQNSITAYDRFGNIVTNKSAQLQGFSLVIDNRK